MASFEQGDILKVTGIEFPVIVASSNVYNQTGKAIVCPMLQGTFVSPTTYISAAAENMTVLCDQVRYLDLRKRNFRKTGSLTVYDMVEISDIIESIFDYY